MLAALCGGWEAGLLATTLCSLLAYAWTQQGQLTPVEGLTLATFVFSSALASGLSEWLHSALRLLRSDMVEHRRAETALRESEEKFRCFFKYSNVGKSITSPAGELQVNQAFCDMLGYSPAELEHLSWQAISHPEDIEPTQRAIDTMLSGKQDAARFTKRYLHKSGSIVWADVSTTLRRDSAGQPLHFMTAVVDITERINAETALRESESRFRQLAESLPQLVWTCRTEGSCDYLNRRWIEFTGVPESRQLGFGWLEQLHPDDRAPTIAAWEAAVASGMDFRVEFRIRRHDGEYRWFETQAVRLRDAAGRTVKWFGSNTDVTERKHTEDEIRRLNADLEARVHARTAELETSNKELEAFSYSVSHDLRTPLRAIDGFTRILTEDYAAQLDTEGRRLAGIIRSETARMGQLIDDLLAFSRMNRRPFDSAEVPMTDLAQAAIGDAVASSPDRRLQIRLLPLAPAHGDPAMLRQVLVNLLSNAVKYTRPREVAEIEVGGYPHGQENVYYVKDNGVGFDMKYAGKLFGVFQRLHSEADFEGTGVGLASVQRIIHRHGGRVWAEAKPNAGATFLFALPAKTPKP